MDDLVFYQQCSVNTLPPAAGKLTLVDDPAGQAGADQRQQPVAILGAQVMAPAIATDACQAVQPVHPVQALHNRDALPPGAPQTHQVACPTDHQHCLVGSIRQVLADLDAAGSQPIRQLVLEGDHPAYACQARDEANPGGALRLSAHASPHI